MFGIEKLKREINDTNFRVNEIRKNLKTYEKLHRSLLGYLNISQEVTTDQYDNVLKIETKAIKKCSKCKQEIE